MSAYDIMEGNQKKYHRIYYLENREVLAERARQYYWDLALHKRKKKEEKEQGFVMKAGEYVIKFE